MAWRKSPPSVCFKWARPASNVIFSARAYPSGPVYLRDSQGKTLDNVYAADFRRVSVILDSDGHLAGNSTSYYGCFSGVYETSFSPTLLTADVKIKRKQALLYEYDSGSIITLLG